MPFSESMLSTLRSNKAMKLDKTKRFRKTLGGYDWSTSMQFNFSKTTPQELKRIREKIQQDNKRILRKQIIIFIVLIVILIMSFMYFIQ